MLEAVRLDALLSSRTGQVPEICDGLSCCEGKLAHLGVGAAPKRSTLSYANRKRPWELYETVFYQLLEKCRLVAPGRTKFQFRNKLLSMDATVIDLCLNLFEWAKFRQTKGAVKLHLMLDHDGYLPIFAQITKGSVADVKVEQGLDLPRGSVVVVDRPWLHRLRSLRAMVLTRRLLRDTPEVQRSLRGGRETRGSPNRGSFSDEIIRYTGPVTKHKCPHLRRRIVYEDKETSKELVFITNQLTPRCDVQKHRVTFVTRR